MEKPDFFQANLNRLMLDKGWSLKRLAAESRVSYHTVFRAVSKGILPRGGNQQKLAKALGVSVALLHEDPNKHQNQPLPPASQPQWDPSAEELGRILHYLRHSEPVTRLSALVMLTNLEVYKRQLRAIPGGAPFASVLETFLRR